MKHWFYVGKKECGCIVACAVDEQKYHYTIADDIAEWIRNDLIVEHIKAEDIQIPTMCALHQKKLEAIKE